MDISAILEVAGFVVIMAGLGLAIYQLHRARLRRERESSLRIYTTYTTSDFVRGYNTVLELHEGTGADEILCLSKSQRDDVHYFLATMEGLGLLVYQGQIDIELVEDNWSGLIVVGWDRVHSYAQYQRDATGRQTLHEWCQWLAERIQKRESSTPPIPAYKEYESWES